MYIVEVFVFGGIFMKEFFENKAIEFGFENFIVIVDFLYRIGLCAITVVVGHIILKFLTHTLKRAFKKMKRKGETAVTVCSSVLKYFVYFCVGCQILIIFGVNPASIMAVAGVGSVALGLGAQSLVGDIISGIFILMENQYEVGDVIQVGDYQGTVESIGLKTTRLRNYNGDVYIIPNGEVKIVTNGCKEFNRAILEIGTPYEADTGRIIEILKAELSRVYINGEVADIIKAPEVLGITAFDNSSVVIRISVDCSPGSQWAVERALRLKIKYRFEQEGISIPYSQSVVHIRKEDEYGA